MEEDERQHANVQSLAVTHVTHQQKDQIWLFAQRMCSHCGKMSATMSPHASHLLPSTILTTISTPIITCMLHMLASEGLLATPMHCFFPFWLC